jgi:toxin ParE1/3/4
VSRTIILTRKAKTDLAAIWDYTFREHGEAQADSYLADIDRMLALALGFPNIGLDYSYIRRGYRKIASGHHLIFYVPRDNVIEVIRVLHERMDIDAHL